MADLVREMDSPVDSEIHWKTCETLRILALESYQVEVVEAVCFNKRDTLVCVRTGSRKSTCFEGMRTVIDYVTGRERAS